HISQREGGSDQKLLPLKFHAVVDKLWKWNQHVIEFAAKVHTTIHNNTSDNKGNEHQECSFHSPPCSGESFVDGAFDNACGSRPCNHIDACPVVELGILAGSAQRNWISSSTLTESVRNNINVHCE
ncbi:conserved hypothetical protein, partial [Trichinella spiralis]|uniref:hypothetical protein n=1 Tax=Trichinella spiralis TaxID=6334 RepID=UPI0001EFDAC6